MVIEFIEFTNLRHPRNGREFFVQIYRVRFEQDVYGLFPEASG